MNQNQMPALQAMMVFLPILILIGSLIVIIPYWMIFKKAGFRAFLGILMVVPLVNIVLLYVLVFAQWKLTPQNVQVWSAPGYPPQG